jgi:hypothetical protein
MISSRAARSACWSPAAGNSSASKVRVSRQAPRPAGVRVTTSLRRSAASAVRVTKPSRSSLSSVRDIVWFSTLARVASSVWLSGPPSSRWSAMSPACVRPCFSSASAHACSTRRAAVDSRRPVGQAAIRPSVPSSVAVMDSTVRQKRPTVLDPDSTEELLAAGPRAVPPAERPPSSPGCYRSGPHRRAPDPEPRMPVPDQHTRPRSS